MIAKYGDEKTFLERFKPDAQLTALQNVQQCFSSDFPTLSEVNLAYGDSSAATWIALQLVDLSEFCGCKDKLMGRSLEQCAELIAQIYYWLKVSELLLFFARLKAGNYGRFYGAVDPMVIMEALKRFVYEDRSNAIDEMERQRADEQRKRWDEEYKQSLANHPELVEKYG